MRILLAEDEVSIADPVAVALTAEGHAVDVVPDGSEVLGWVEAYPYDLAILDVRLPGLDGLTICAELRNVGFGASILMLTALSEIRDRVAGLDAGADDYLPKPFDMAELLARVRALLRRGADRSPTFRVADLEVDPATHQVRVGGSAVRLTTREFALLEVLARRPNHLFSQDRLLDAVWDAGFEPGSNVVEVHIRSLRRKIDGGRRDGLIETVRGAGYRLRAEREA